MSPMIDDIDESVAGHVAASLPGSLGDGPVLRAGRPQAAPDRSALRSVIEHGERA